MYVYLALELAVAETVRPGWRGVGASFVPVPLVRFLNRLSPPSIKSGDESSIYAQIKQAMAYNIYLAHATLHP